MSNMPNKDILLDILAELDSLSMLNHNPPGILHQRCQRLKASLCEPEQEQEAIYRLVDSHVPSFRNKTTMNYEMLAKSDDPTDLLNVYVRLLKDNVRTKCPGIKIEANIKDMLRQIEEMPKEWTIVQLTPSYSPKEEFNMDKDKYETTPINISVFNCGQTDISPLLMTVDAPKDRVNGNKVELVNEMMSIIIENKEALCNTNQKFFKNEEARSAYINRRQSVEDRLKMLVKDIQNMWLQEWRCLLIGKYFNEDLDKKIRDEINIFLRSEVPDTEFTPKVLELLYYIVKGSTYLQLIELRKAVQSCLPKLDNKKLQKNLCLFIRNLKDKLHLGNPSIKRHPVILVVDEKLDMFPWEMIDILQEQPVSRLPSLHFVYFLYKVHECDIKEGYKIVAHYEKGAYVVNPDSDLQNMEIRMMNFFNYWLSNWTGISGYKPTAEEFVELLTSSDIFSYNGHGSGSHLMTTDKLKKTHVKAVVLLFGCGSTKTSRLGPQVEMYGSYHTYLIARCPCIVGMLWEVTDTDTDVLTTEFMSRWIPSNAPTHWKYVDKMKWKRSDRKLTFIRTDTEESSAEINELELSRALNLSKKSSQYYLTRCACVVRGLPVKIVKNK